MSMNGTAQTQSQPVDWEQALSEHKAWLRSVVAARLGEPQAVDDVLQNVAMAVAKGGPATLESGRVAPWLYQVAVRQTLMYRRTAGRRRNLVDRFADRTRPTEANSREVDPLHWLMAQERATKIQQSIQDLHHRDREILLLKYEHGWKYDDIATHLGISHSAVEARLHRARKRLRERLAKRDVLLSQKSRGNGNE